MNQTGKNTKISKPSYLYSIISITLVLFMLGLLGVILLQAQSISTYFKENIEVTVILKGDADLKEVANFQQRMNSRAYVKSTNYIPWKEADEEYTKIYKEDFKDILGYSPLFSSINIYLQASYANKDSLVWIKQALMKEKVVSEIFYQEVLVDAINANASKIGILLFGLSIILLLIAFTLIDNTIKLAMYSNRFLVKSMQLVGATRQFISQPFIHQSVYNGIVSGLLAALILVIVLLLAQKSIPELAALHNTFQFLLLCISIIFTGIAISWWSTKKAVIKYLQMRLDDLY